MVHVRRPRRLLALLLVTLGTALGLGVLVPGGPAAAQDGGAATTSQAGTTSVRAAELPDVLRVGTEGVYPPFSYHDDQDRLTGFDIEVIEAVAERLGIEVEFVETPWDSMFAALGADRFDLVANQVTLTPERQQLYDLSDPYVETTGVVVVREDEEEIQSLEDIRGKRAGEGLTSNWKDVAEDAGAEIVGIDELGKAIDNLEQGRVDVVVNDELAVRNYLTNAPNAAVKIVDETEDTSQSVFAARKGSGFMPQINKAIAELEADGTLKQLYDKYFTAEPDVPSRFELVKNNLVPLLEAAVTKTIPLTAISFTIGLFIALFVALARMSRNPVLFLPARFYISLIRGTPLLVQLFIIFYGLPEFDVRIDPFLAAVIAFSLNVGGYAAEVIRSAIESIPKGQWEAASTIGMGFGTTLRRVILPQAARTAVPPLSNTLISLVKDTSLASTILVVELFRQAQIAASPTFQYFTMYSLAALYYWVICLALSFLQSHTETRLNRFVAR